MEKATNPMEPYNVREFVFTQLHDSDECTWFFSPISTFLKIKLIVTEETWSHLGNPFCFHMTKWPSRYFLHVLYVCKFDIKVLGQYTVFPILGRPKRKKVRSNTLQVTKREHWFLCPSYGHALMFPDIPLKTVSNLSNHHSNYFHSVTLLSHY